MQHEAAILFAYYGRAPQAVVEKNLVRIRACNPGVPVIPLLYDGPAFIPGSVDVSGGTAFREASSKWHGCDVMLYRWFNLRSLKAKRFIYLEWDTYCSTSVRDFYDPVWNADLAAVETFAYAQNPKWHWFHQVYLFGIEQSVAGGLVPFAGTLLSHDGLEAICRVPFYPDLFCELRLATAARRAGLTMQSMPFARGMISWEKLTVDVRAAPGIYHPVKELLPNFKGA